MMNTNFLSNGFTRIIILTLTAAAIFGCTSSGTGSGSGGTFAVPVADLPACNSSNLAPFAAVGTGSRPTQLPVGQYNYTWGEVHIETLNQSPNVTMHLQDNNPNAQNYSGNMVCLTANAPFLVADTFGYLFRFMNITGTQFNFAITRQLNVSSDGNTVTNVLTSDDPSLIMSNAEAIAKENQVLSHCFFDECDQLNVYQTGVNTYRVILIRVSSKNGVVARFHVRGDYTKIQ